METWIFSLILIVCVNVSLTMVIDHWNISFPAPVCVRVQSQQWPVSRATNRLSRPRLVSWTRRWRNCEENWRMRKRRRLALSWRWEQLQWFQTVKSKARAYKRYMLQITVMNIHKGWSLHTDSVHSPSLLKGQENTVGPDGLRLTKLEVATVLWERNEYKEKYLSLLEQIRWGGVEGGVAWAHDTCLLILTHYSAYK